MSTDSLQITVGLDVGYEAIRMVAIEHTPDRPLLYRVGVQPLLYPRTPQTMFSGIEDVATAVHTLMETYSDPAWPIVVGLRNRFATVMLPHVDKTIDRKTVFEWLMWEAAQVVAEPIENYVVDVSPTGNETDAGRDILIVAARQESVNGLMNLMRAAEVAPVGMSVATSALINAFEKTHTISEWESAAIAHIEPGAVDIIFIHGKTLNLAVMPLEQGQENGDQALHTFGSQFRHLLNVMPEEESPDTIYVSSDRTDIDELCSHWGDQLNRRITPVAPFQGLQISSAQEEPISPVSEAAFMVATGLALQRVE